MPGAVCGLPQPVRLHAAQATVTPPPNIAEEAATPQIVLSEATITYGDLGGEAGEVAAVNIWCANTGGMADGQMQDSWVIYALEAGTLTVIHTLIPQEPASDVGGHVPYFDQDPGSIVIQPGKIRVIELWYGPGSGTCCPNIYATTVWTYADGTLTPSSPTTSTSTTAPPGQS